MTNKTTNTIEPSGDRHDANGTKPEETGEATMVESVITLEWRQFQNTNNEGGRASCQGNWPMFHEMRASQFLTWPAELLSSYRSDLQEADRTGRNLVTEKYGRMMQSTYPQEYCANIEPYIPRLSASRVAMQERIIATQVAWARDFRERWPRLGMAMRMLTTDEDTPQATSFETYLRGELGTYSERTIALYDAFVSRLLDERRNLTEETIRNTVKLAGFDGLDEAEAAQR
ncbi:MAG TPA: DUF4125 domain-containing protein [Bifidobacterium sp.]|nr:DUF4125 domain-containing protein [Bifidobacterium sp.]